MSRKIDMRGLRFGKWTVQGKSKRVKNGPKHKVTYWLCRCDCSNTAWVYVGSLRGARSKGCRQCSEIENGRLKAIANGFIEGQPRLTQTRWYRVLQGAKRRGREVTITREEAVSILVRQNNRCAVTGWPISLPTRTRGPLSVGGTASLDRIDNQKGYVPGNIRWTHWTINKMKGALSEAEFLKACQAVVAALNLGETPTRKLSEREPR